MGGREERKEKPTAVPSSPGRGLHSPQRAAQRAAPASPGHGRGGGGSCSRLPQLSDVGGEERGRAGGQSAELGSQRGAPRRPQPPTVCKRPAPGLGGESCNPKREHPLLPSAAGLVCKALRPRTGRSQVGLLVTAARSRELREDAAQTEGAARRCAPSLSLSLGETNLLSGSQLSNLPIMILA